jgi:hypothetical protein
MLLLTVSSSTVAARAEPRGNDGEELVQHGIELRKAGKNGDALAEFEKAYALSPTPRTRAQIALALHALGDWIGAERGLLDALSATDDPWVAQYRDVLEGALATVRAHLASLTVSTNAPTGELVINRVTVHALPLREPVRVVAGTLDIAVRAPGFRSADRVIELAAASERHEVFELEPVAEPAAPSPANVNALRSGADTPQPTTRRNPVPGYLALGAAGALAGGGFAAWRVHETDVAIYNDDGKCLLGTRTRGQQCGNYADAANAAFAVETAAFALSAAAAGTGVWLLLAAGKSAKLHGAWCSPSGPRGLVCGADF